MRKDIKKLYDKKVLLFATDPCSMLRSCYPEDLAEALCRTVLKAVKHIEDVHLIIKLHHCDTYKDIYKKLIKEFKVQNVYIIKKENIHDLINLSCVVIHHDSTVSLEAMILDRPVITLRLVKKSLLPFVELGVALLARNSEELIIVIRKILKENKIMKRCTKCIMPETKPGISFNELGVCNACINSELKNKIDWDTRFKELQKVASVAKKKKPTGYNCLVPVSGGKDSHFLAITAKEKLGLTPLLVYVEPNYITELGKKNLNNLSKQGFDIFVFKPNQKIMPALLKRSLYEDGQPGRAFEFILYSVPMRMAINYKIPLVFWGENSQFEYGNTGKGIGASANELKTCAAIGNKDSTHWQIEGLISKEDLLSYQHPTKEELDNAGVNAVYMSHYIKWDSRMTRNFAIKRGLSIRPDNPEELLGTGGYWGFEQLDDEMPIVSHLFKYTKFGYGRATDQACRDIRWGHITREKGLELVAKFDGQCNPGYIKEYCEYIGISMDEFWKVVDSYK